MATLDQKLHSLELVWELAIESSTTRLLRNLLRTESCPARARITPDSELLLKALLIFNKLVAVSKFAFNPCQQNE